MSFSYPYTYTSIDYLGATSAYGINDTGQIVGTTGNPSVGFLDNFGTFTSINYPGGNYTDAYDINATGQIVGCT